MAVNGITSRSLERAEEYMPQAFRDVYCQIAQRTYKHSECSKSASYEAFKLAKDANGFRCPMCFSRENIVTPNTILDRAISSFMLNFNFRNDTDAKSSYKLAWYFFKEERFVSAHKICERALNFSSIDSQNHKNLMFLAGRILQCQLGINTNLQQIESYKKEIKTFIEQLKKTQDPDQVKQLQKCGALCFVAIAYEKNNIARKYLDNKMLVKAFDTFKEAILLFEKVQNIKGLDSDIKRSFIVDLTSSLTSLGDLLASLNRFSDAKDNYKKSIKHLKAAISVCENKDDFIQDLDKVSFKLSKAYLGLADQCNIQSSEYAEAKKYLEKSQKTLENIKEKNEEITSFSDQIVQKIEIIELKLLMADLIRLYNEGKSNNK
ncbi:MAG: hypothetical protein K940chlam5_01161 [Candidatus Anoxychlamydiales bacterium]|nr:hypothetical protein [Candidatus Anoxychlamydiales bacterium]